MADKASPAPPSVSSGLTMARQFNGTDQGLSAALTLSGNSLLSVGFWGYWNAWASDKVMMEYSENAAPAAGGWLYYDNSAGFGGTTLYTVQTGSAANSVREYTPPSAAAWHHYLFTYDLTNSSVPVLLLYVDGGAATPVSSVDASAGGFLDRTLHVMCRANASLFGAGRMADLAIWTSVLTSGNATTLAAGARANTVGTPAHYWRIDGTTSPEPATLGGVDLTLVGSPTFVADPSALSGAAPVVNVSPGRTAWRGAWRGANRGA